MEIIQNQNRKINFWTKVLCLLIFLPLAAFLSDKFLLVAVLSLLGYMAFVIPVRIGRFISQSLIYVLPVAAGIFIIYFVVERQMFFEFVFWKAALLSLRFALAIASGVLFSLATDPMEFPLGFMQAKIPHRFGVALMVSYRMMPLLSKKITMIVDAQRGRGASFGFNIFRSFDFFYRLNSLVVPILYNTLSMSVRLSDALIARGYDPYGKISFISMKLGINDIIILFLSAIIFALSFALPLFK